MYDLIIVGETPSGSSARRAAGKRGFQRFIDKVNFTRYKPCGGAFSLYAYA